MLLLFWGDNVCSTTVHIWTRGSIKWLFGQWPFESSSFLFGAPITTKRSDFYRPLWCAQLLNPFRLFHCMSPANVRLWSISTDSVVLKSIEIWKLKNGSGILNILNIDSIKIHQSCFRRIEIHWNPLCGCGQRAKAETHWLNNRPPHSQTHLHNISE